MKCKFCQSELGQDTLFCPNCGKDLSGFDKCVKCGELLDSDAVFCPYCGTEQPHEEPEESAGSRKWLWVSLIALVLAVGGGCFYFLSSRGEAETISADSGINDSDDPIFVRLTAIYDDVFSGGANANRKYCSKSYNEILDAFDQTYYNSSRDDWMRPDVDHWIVAQDAINPSMSIISISNQSDKNATAKVHIDHGSGGSGADVELKLVYENGDWFIDDFCYFGKSEKQDYQESSIRIRLTTIYDDVFGYIQKDDYGLTAEDQYCSISYKSLVGQFNDAYENSSLKGELIGPEASHWLAAQDAIKPSMDIVNISLQSDTTAMAKVHIDHGDGNSGADVELKLLLEYRDWVIDDFIYLVGSERQIYQDAIKELEKHKI